ncbi:hypothetical protein T492DRAFT_968195 [Pavlovales sp. CCMP2436]|nr:hypothetical protein T492DRAFT_968195 [Pavlovales sp. CCMP2436]
MRAAPTRRSTHSLAMCFGFPAIGFVFGFKMVPASGVGSCSPERPERAASSSSSSSSTSRAASASGLGRFFAPFCRPEGPAPPKASENAASSSSSSTTCRAISTAFLERFDAPFGARSLNLSMCATSLSMTSSLPAYNSAMGRHCASAYAMSSERVKLLRAPCP